MAIKTGTNVRIVTGSERTPYTGPALGKTGTVLLPYRSPGGDGWVVRVKGQEDQVFSECYLEVIEDGKN